MATAQAKSAIEKLRAAGLPRSWFSVTTERNYCGLDERGKSCYEYGDARISFKKPSLNILPFAEAMAAQGLRVELLKFKNLTSIWVFPVKRRSPAGLWEIDYTDLDEYKLPRETRIK